MSKESKQTIGNGPLMMMAVILTLMIFPAPLLLICTISVFFAYSPDGPATRRETADYKSAPRSVAQQTHLW